MLRFERLTTASDPPYPMAMSLYAESFPFHEQREEASQRRILSEEAYHFTLIYDGPVWAGEILYWETDAFIYVEHFCILPKLRGRRYGQQALALLQSYGKTVILEIDPPVDPVSIRRKGFYERCGYRPNPFPHVHPPYHVNCDGHKLVIMTCPREISRAEYDAFNRYLQTVVMKNVTERNV